MMFPGRAHKDSAHCDVYEFFPKGKILIGDSFLGAFKGGADPMGIWAVPMPWGSGFEIRGCVINQLGGYHMAWAQLTHGEESFFARPLSAGIGICQMFGGVKEVYFQGKKLFDGDPIYDRNPFWFNGQKWCACGDLIEDEKDSMCWVCKSLDEMTDEQWGKGRIDMSDKNISTDGEK